MTNVVNANIILGAQGAPISTVYSTIHSTSKDVMWNPVQHVEFIYHYHQPEGMNFLNMTYPPYLSVWNWILPVDVAPNLQVKFDPSNSPVYYSVGVDITRGTVQTHYIPIWYRAQANLALWSGVSPSVPRISLGIQAQRRKTDRTLSDGWHCGKLHCLADSQRAGEKDWIQLLYDLHAALCCISFGVHVETIARAIQHESTCTERVSHIRVLLVLLPCPSHALRLLPAACS